MIERHKERVCVRPMQRLPEVDATRQSQNKIFIFFDAVAPKLLLAMVRFGSITACRHNSSSRIFVQCSLTGYHEQPSNNSLFPEFVNR